MCLCRAFTRVPRCMRVMLLMQEPAFWCRTRMCCTLFTSRGMSTHTSRYCRERASKSDAEEKRLLNEVVIFVFFAQKSSLIKLRLNHWCHMDYFNDVLTTFLGLEHVNYFTVYTGSKALGFHQKYLNLCSEDEWRSYGSGLKLNSWSATALRSLAPTSSKSHLLGISSNPEDLN